MVDGEKKDEGPDEKVQTLKHGDLFETDPNFEVSSPQLEKEKANSKEEVSKGDVQHGETLVRPTCSTEHQCCAQYEFCVSSCLDFTWQRLHSTTVNARSSVDTAAGAVLQLIERLVGDHQAEDDNVAKEYSGTTDLFDWCLLRCRTSGRSVVHQNSFRSSLKHCYGLKDPPLLARLIEKGETE